MANSKFVLTDSGGIQEESTYLGIPCITMRDNTERPITVEVGSNYLIGLNISEVIKVGNNIINGKMKSHAIPELWDGHAAERIVKIIVDYLENKNN